MGAVVLGRLTEVPRPRLVGWAILVGALAALSYAANLAGGEPPSDVLYQWSTAVAALVQYGIILAIVLALARGIAPATLGLRRPDSWARAAGWILAALVSIWVLGAILNIFLKAGEEQGLVPDAWDSSRAAPFVANFAVVAVVAPFVEELTYRGLGFAAVRDAYGAGGGDRRDGDRVRTRARARRRVTRVNDLRIDSRDAPTTDQEHLPDDHPARRVQRRRPDRGGDDVNDRFDELRDDIAANDRAIVEAVNLRLRLVEELWRLKAERGDARLDQDRERRLRAELVRLNEGPLSPAGLESLVDELLALTKRELGGA